MEIPHQGYWTIITCFGEPVGQKCYDTVEKMLDACQDRAINYLPVGMIPLPFAKGDQQ